MFDWFKNIRRRGYTTWDDVPPPSDMEKIGEDMNKIVPFPLPEVTQPKERTGKTCYSVGLTDDNRVSLIVGYGSVTMNGAGVRQLIDQLTLFKTQIESNEE